MARVPYLSREDLRPEDRDIYDDLVARRGGVLNLFRVLAHTPALLRRLVGYSTEIRFGLTLDPHLRELAILTVGRLCGASYEQGHHWNVARRAGVPREKLEALAAYDDAPGLTARERAGVRGCAVQRRGDARCAGQRRDLRRAALVSGHPADRGAGAGRGVL